MRDQAVSRVAAAVVAFTLMAVTAAAQPPVRQMSGKPLPVSDLSPGTITVRVLRGSLANPVTDHPVVLTGTGQPITVKTNASGRAEFTGLTPGARVSAEATVDGEKLLSEPFEVPHAGGIRLMLVTAADPGAAPSEPRVPTAAGSIALGDETRFVFEFGQDGFNVFNIIPIVNAAATPVDAAPVVFELPDAAEQVSLMDGSTPQASVAGRRVTVTGPFAPGATVLQFAYTIELRRSTMTLTQKIPADLPQLTVIVQKMGQTDVTSAQFARQRDMQAEGQVYILGHGPAIKAGGAFTLNFTGLPHQPAWPAYTALAIAAAILIGGAWFSMRVAPPTVDAASAKLRARRDRLFAELTDLEAEHRRGAVDPARYEARRRELIESLERVYAQMDEEAAA